jgi:hypothetical protein
MKRIMLLLSMLLITVISATAQKQEIFSADGGAIHGYDAVAYFKEGKPVKGNASFTYRYKDANWLFVSKENADAFKADPGKFLPQYGGYCAYGLSEGHKAPTDPNAFTIVDNKLYLNYNLKVKENWSKDRQQRINTADKLWPGLKNK